MVRFAASSSVRTPLTFPTYAFQRLFCCTDVRTIVVMVPPGSLRESGDRFTAVSVAGLEMVAPDGAAATSTDATESAIARTSRAAPAACAVANVRVVIVIASAQDISTQK